MTDSTPPLIHFQPTLTPTIRRQRLQHGTNKISPPQTTIASVKVEWKHKTVNCTLPKDLESIRKKLCGGTYTRIKVREQFVLLFLKEIFRGCSNMCSKKNPSTLRKTSEEDIVNFSLTELDNELKDKQVVLHLVNIHCIAA